MMRHRLRTADPSQGRSLRNDGGVEAARRRRRSIAVSVMLAGARSGFFAEAEAAARGRVAPGKPREPARLPRRIVADEPDSGDPRCLRNDRILRRLGLSRVLLAACMGSDLPRMRCVMHVLLRGPERCERLGGDDECRRDGCQR